MTLQEKIMSLGLTPEQTQGVLKIAEQAFKNGTYVFYIYAAGKLRPEYEERLQLHSLRDCLEFDNDF